MGETENWKVGENMVCLLFDELLIHEVPDTAEDGNAGDNNNLANGLEYVLHMNAPSVFI